MRFVARANSQKPCTIIADHHGTYDKAAENRQQYREAEKKRKKDGAAKPQTRQDSVASSSSEAVQQQIAVVDVVQTRKTIDEIIKLLMKLKGHLVEFNLGVPAEVD